MVAVMFRLEAIAQDAELEEHSKSELEQLGKELLNGCLNAQAESENMTKEVEKRANEEGKKKHVCFCFILFEIRFLQDIVFVFSGLMSLLAVVFILHGVLLPPSPPIPL